MVEDLAVYQFANSRMSHVMHEKQLVAQDREIRTRCLCVLRLAAAAHLELLELADLGRERGDGVVAERELRELRRAPDLGPDRGELV